MGFTQPPPPPWVKVWVKNTLDGRGLKKLLCKTSLSNFLMPGDLSSVSGVRLKYGTVYKFLIESDVFKLCIE